MMLNGGGGLAIDSIVLEFWSALFAAAALVGLECDLTGVLSQDIHTKISAFTHSYEVHSPVREFRPLAKGGTKKQGDEDVSRPNTRYNPLPRYHSTERSTTLGACPCPPTTKAGHHHPFLCSISEIAAASRERKIVLGQIYPPSTQHHHSPSYQLLPHPNDARDMRSTAWFPRPYRARSGSPSEKDPLSDEPRVLIDLVDRPVAMWDLTLPDDAAFLANGQHLPCRRWP